MFLSLNSKLADSIISEKNYRILVKNNSWVSQKFCNILVTWENLATSDAFNLYLWLVLNCTESQKQAGAWNLTSSLRVLVEYPRRNQGEWFSSLVNSQHKLDSMMGGGAQD